VRIDDELYRRVKQRAATERRTVAAVLEDAVRVGMAAPESLAADRFVLVLTGEGGLQPGVELSSNAALREAAERRPRLRSIRTAPLASPLAD